MRESQALVELHACGGNFLAIDILDVRGAFQIFVMIGQYDTIFCALHIALQIVGTHLTGPAP